MVNRQSSITLQIIIKGFSDFELWWLTIHKPLELKNIAIEFCIKNGIIFAVNLFLCLRRKILVIDFRWSDVMIEKDASLNTAVNWMLIIQHHEEILEILCGFTSRNWGTNFDHHFKSWVNWSGGIAVKSKWHFRSYWWSPEMTVTTVLKNRVWKLGVLKKKRIFWSLDFSLISCLSVWCNL